MDETTKFTQLMTESAFEAAAVEIENDVEEVFHGMPGMLEEWVDLGGKLASLKAKATGGADPAAWNDWVARRFSMDARTAEFAVMLHQDLQPNAHDALYKLDFAQTFDLISSTLKRAGNATASAPDFA